MPERINHRRNNRYDSKISGLRLTGTSIVVTFRKSRLTEELMNKLDLNERQREAIEYIKEQGRITSGEYQKIFDVSRQTAHKDVSKMIDSELLKRKGKGKETYYVLRHKYVTKCDGKTRN